MQFTLGAQVAIKGRDFRCIAIVENTSKGYATYDSDEYLLVHKGRPNTHWLSAQYNLFKKGDPITTSYTMVTLQALDDSMWTIHIYSNLRMEKYDGRT